jgi:hypothetical protein
MQVHSGGVCTYPLPQNLQALLEHAGCGSTPSRVQDCHRAVLRIDDVHWDAVGGGYAEQKAGRGCRVTITRLGEV